MVRFSLACLVAMAALSAAPAGWAGDLSIPSLLPAEVAGALRSWLAETSAGEDVVPLDVFTGPPIAPGQSVDVRPYYPVSVGSYWEYQDQVAGGVRFKLQITKKVPVNGTQAHFFLRQQPYETDSITSDASGILLHAQERTNRDGSRIATTWTPPVKFAAPTIKLGDIFTSIPSFVNPGTGNKMKWTSRIVGTADVTVPAGTFKNAVRIKVVVADAVLGVKLSDFEMWVAKDIGVVQRQGNFFGSYFVQKLLSWNVAPSMAI